MNSRKSKGKPKGKVIVFLASIVALNAIGITYGQWNSGLTIDHSIASGEFDPEFKEECSLETVKGEGHLTVNFEDEYTMNVEGQVEPGYAARLYYNVVNDGTLPVKFTGDHVEFAEGLKVNVHHPLKTIEIDENNEKNREYLEHKKTKGNKHKGKKKKKFSKSQASRLQIWAEEEGTYDFELQLPFEQVNSEER